MDNLLVSGLTNVAAAAALALVVFGLGKLFRRPALLHLLWVLVLVKLITPPITFVSVDGSTGGEGGYLFRCLGALWVAGAVLFYLWVGVHLARFRKLMRFAKAPPAWLKVRVAELAGQSGVRVPEVWLLPGPVPPMLWQGWRSNKILFPSDLLPRLKQDGLDTLLAHELAHLRRRDHWVRWLELFVAGLYWWCPVVWWARRQLHLQEEQCCDARVVERWPGRTYAEAIMATIDLLAERRVALPATASGLGRAELLKRRLVAIMTERPRPRVTAPGWAVITLAVTALPFFPGVERQADQAMPQRSPIHPAEVARAPSPDSPAKGVVRAVMIPEGNVMTLPAEPTLDGVLLLLNPSALLEEVPVFPSEDGATWARCTSAVRSAAYSPDGSQIAGRDGQVVAPRGGRRDAGGALRLGDLPVVLA